MGSVERHSAFPHRNKESEYEKCRGAGETAKSVQRAQGPKFNPQHSHKKLSMVTCVCNPGSGETDTGRSLELTDQPG